MVNIDKKRYHDLERKKAELWEHVKKKSKSKKQIEKEIEADMEQIRKIENEQLSMVQYRLFKGE